MNQLLKYCEFNRWANEIILSVVDLETSDEMRDKEIVSSFASLRKTIYHLWDAEFIWLRRLKGESLDNWPSNNFTGNYSEAFREILNNDLYFIEYIKSLDEKKLSGLFTYKNVEGKTFTNPVWESVLHCMNHSTYHRGQIVTMLRQLGLIKIPATDFIAYCRRK